MLPNTTLKWQIASSELFSEPGLVRSVDTLINGLAVGVAGCQKGTAVCPISGVGCDKFRAFLAHPHHERSSALYPVLCLAEGLE